MEQFKWALEKKKNHNNNEWQFEKKEEECEGSVIYVWESKTM